MLASRRRLLYLLLVLALGSGTLAVTKMAAWWVVVPPTIMLLGYMGMLREAARADAERRELARTRAAAAAAKRAAPPVPAAPSAPPAPVPDAEVIDISASLTSVGQEFYDQYADAKLRAVGDLAPWPDRVKISWHNRGPGYFSAGCPAGNSSLVRTMRSMGVARTKASSAYRG